MKYNATPLTSFRFLADKQPPPEFCGIDLEVEREIYSGSHSMCLPAQLLFGEMRDGLLLRAKQHQRLILRVWELIKS